MRDHQPQDPATVISSRHPDSILLFSLVVMFYREEGSQVQDGGRTCGVCRHRIISSAKSHIDNHLGICIYPEALMSQQEEEDREQEERAKERKNN